MYGFPASRVILQNAEPNNNMTQRKPVICWDTKLKGSNNWNPLPIIGLGVSYFPWKSLIEVLWNMYVAHEVNYYDV